MKYYLAVDIGASSGRHILASTDGGKIYLEEIYRFDNGPIEKDGSLFWDVEYLYTQIVAGLKKAKEIGKIPHSIGVDTWGVDYALLDKEDKVIGGVYAYRDSRTEKQIPLVHKKVPFESLYENTGLGFASYNTVYQLSDDLYSGRMEKAESLLMLPDYFHFRLTGVKRQEYSNATTTGLINARTKEWDKEIICTLGYKEKLFSPISRSGEIVGGLTDALVKEIGYTAKVVLSATHDTASAILGAPIDEEMAFISSGTWSILGVEQSRAFTDEKALASGYSNEGGHEGKNYLLKNIMGLWIIQRLRKELAPSLSYAEIADLARGNPVEEIIDVNDDCFLAPESMANAIWEKAGRRMCLGETAYCVLNSLAVYYAESVKKLEETTGVVYRKINIIGGGSQNALLNELTEKHAKKKILAGPIESTALGNALVQMMADGAISTLEKARELVRKSFEIKEI